MLLSSGANASGFLTGCMRWMLVLPFLLAVHGVWAQGSAAIPAKAFFQQFEFSNVKISPDGQYLAVVGPVKGQEGQSQIDIVKIATSSVYAHYSLKGTFPSGVWWADNDLLLFTTAYRLGWFDQPIATGDVWTLDIHSGKAAKIARGSNVYGVIYRNGGRQGYAKIHLGGYWEFDEDVKSIFEMARDENTHLGPCPKQVALPGTSDEEMHYRPGGYYYHDNAGYPRLWLGYNQLTYAPEMAYSVPCDTEPEWYNLSSFIADEPQYRAYGPWMFTADDSKFYYIGATPAGTIGLYVVDPVTWKKTLLYEDPDYDLEESAFTPNHWLVSDDGVSLLAFEYMADKPVWILIDKTAPEAELLENLEHAFDGQNVVITSRTVDGDQSVLFVSSDRNPGQYYLYNTKTSKADLLFSVLPRIDPDEMAPMQPVQFKARDGLKIHGYLTLPLGQSKNLPMIVLPHGGPFGLRDNWGFDPEVQYFAYHGYAVLQIEYRGSGGYGYAFQKAGYRQWGGTMQDDITDGTRWAIQQGVADPSRICIYGGSYGGYAALEGVVKEPDLYKCAVGYAGVYDLVSFRTHFHTLRYQPYVPAITTELGDDEDYLRAHSPVFHVDKIKAALFLAHGGMDRTVPIGQADELRDALDKIGKPYEWLYYPSEVHGFFKLDHRIELYAKMLTFFDQHIGQPVAAH